MIRPFVITDLDHLLDIEQHSFPKSPHSRATFIRLYQLYPDTFWVDVKQPNGQGKEEVRGYLIFSRGGHLISLAVHPKYRRKGIGKTLIKEAMKTLTAKNMWAEVRRSNQGARAFYQKMGFQIVGILPNYYGEEDALVVQFFEAPGAQGKS